MRAHAAPTLSHRVVDIMSHVTLLRFRGDIADLNAKAYYFSTSRYSPLLCVPRFSFGSPPPARLHTLIVACGACPSQTHIRMAPRSLGLGGPVACATHHTGSVSCCLTFEIEYRTFWLARCCVLAARVGVGELCRSTTLYRRDVRPD